jgi:hypothetical protein
MLRKFLLAGAIIAVLTAPAAAQFPMPGVTLKDQPKTETPEERARRKAIDDAYNAANKKIPDKQVADPWASVRPNPSAPSQRSSN